MMKTSPSPVPARALPGSIVRKVRAKDSSLSVDERLLAAMRRHRKLLKAYGGAQPADRELRRELEWAIEAFVEGDEPRMLRLVARLNSSLPPMGMSEARARRLGIARIPSVDEKG